MEARKRSTSATSCKKHPKHRQSPGICSLCLRERLSKISSSSSRAVTNVSSSSSSSSSVSSISSAYSSTNASSYTASPMHNYRNRRKIDSLEGRGYLYLLKKSRSMALQDQGKKKGGFWSKLMGPNTPSSRMMHSRTTRETFLSRV